MEMEKLMEYFECVEWQIDEGNDEGEKCCKLQTLDMDRSDLTSVPSSIIEIEYFAFRAVEAVSFNHNPRLASSAILGRLDNLQVVNMWGCALRAVPETWIKLKNLRFLGLGNNPDLREFAPLAHLTSLKSLDIGYCGLQQLPDEVYSLGGLRTLSVAGNLRIRFDLSRITGLESLARLALNDCGLVDEVPGEIFKLVTLRRLHLDRNDLCTLDRGVLNLTALTQLTVTGNPRLASVPNYVNLMDTLTQIYVDERLVKPTSLLSRLKLSGRSFYQTAYF